MLSYPSAARDRDCDRLNDQQLHNNFEDFEGDECLEFDSDGAGR